MDPVERSIARKALFAVTDPRTLTTIMVALSALFAYSVSAGARTEVVYAWNAPPQRAASVAPDRAELDGLPGPDDTQDAPAPDEATEATVDTESDAERPVETTGGAPQASSGSDRAELERRALEAAQREARLAREAEQAAALAAAEAAAREPPPPVGDLTPIEDAVAVAEAAIASEEWESAAETLVNLGQLTSGVDSPLLRSGGALRTRIDRARDDVALYQFEQDILAAVRLARGAQESGNYPEAIGALRSLTERTRSAPPSRARRMEERLSFWQVVATERTLLEACQFERQSLGRTAPCTG